MLPLALRFEHAVSLLPLRLRPVARTAAAGSHADLQRLIEEAKAGPETQKLLFLPIFYANIDSRRMPSPAEIDTASTPDVVDRLIANGLCSLDYISLLKDIPAEVALHVWNRSWEWIQLLDNYLPLCLRAEPALYATFTLVIGKMVQDSEASKSVYSTSGPRRIVARAWRLLLPLREEQTFDALKAVYSFLCPKDASRETHAAYLDELFEGAGGGPPDLASLLLSHLNLHVQRAPHSMQSLFFVTHALDFLLTNSPSHVPFTEGLIRHGVITTFTHLAHIFSAAPSDEPAVKTLLKCAWDYLDIQFSGRHGYRLVGEAIRAGLFRAIIAAATLDNFPASVASVIETLGPYTAYYSVLSCISPALHDVKDLQASLVVTKSDLFNKWSDFWDLAQERMAIMRYYESDAYVSLKACDALECGQIHPKRQLVRCSRCKWRHYCSKRCQVVDWKDGHRSTCHSIHSIVQNEPEHFSTRDRSFLRALLDNDYKEWRLDILQHELEFLDAFPEDNPFILFDYRRGHMSFRILREGGPGELGELDLQWQDGIARAARSVGRIQSHAMVLPDGHDYVLRFFPMYSSSSALWDGLKQLKNEVDEGVGGSAPIHSQIPGRILALASTVERLVVQVH